MDHWHCECMGSGDGPTILLLHGFMGSGEDWRPLEGLLGNRFSLLAPDLPGHGRTRIESGDAAYAMPEVARSIIGLLDYLNIETCPLVGYSMGGRVALFLALRYPGRFSRVVLESASPGLETAQERAERVKRDEERARELETGDLAAFLDAWYAQPIFGSLRTHPAFDGLLQARLQNDPGMLATSLRRMGTGVQPSLWGELPGMKIPLLVLAGERDEKFRIIADRMAKRCPSARMAVIPGCGHSIHVEQPEAFASLVKDFVG
ncbi:MAG: 2-succinyl-6-hydroxy-2,4-cyclohexadiene-1-carboxylate synthase [bacterium]